MEFAAAPGSEELESDPSATGDTRQQVEGGDDDNSWMQVEGGHDDNSWMQVEGDDDDSDDSWMRGFQVEEIFKGDQTEDEEKEDESDEKNILAPFRDGWSARAADFQDITAFSSMMFTYATPGRLPRLATVATALQVYSVKIGPAERGLYGSPTIQEDYLKWPLQVYGVVAARDSVDYSRNLLFLRGRNHCQTLEKYDPFLQLIGPSRAIVFDNPVIFEIELKLKGGTKSKDGPLFADTFRYNGTYGGLRTPLSNDRCTVTLSFQELCETVQATILSVRVSQGPWPFENGCRVAACTDSSNARLVLLQSLDPLVPDGDGGNYLDLPRRVVSVGLKGWLHVYVWADVDTPAPIYGATADRRGVVSFAPKLGGVSQDTCVVGDSTVEVIVAWSLVLRTDSILEDGHLRDDARA